jgi:hypothetical protein
LANLFCLESLFESLWPRLRSEAIWQAVPPGTTEFRIRIHLIRIRIQGFYDQKFRKKFTAKKKFTFILDKKTTNCLSLGLGGTPCTVGVVQVTNLGLIHHFTSRKNEKSVVKLFSFRQICLLNCKKKTFRQHWVAISHKTSLNFDSERRKYAYWKVVLKILIIFSIVCEAAPFVREYLSFQIPDLKFFAGPGS